MSNKNPSHTIEIPQFFLLTIAVHGNMGDGELPDLMRRWAESECEQLGLTAELRQLQEERYQELRRRVANVMGEKTIEIIEDKVEQVIRKLTS